MTQPKKQKKVAVTAPTPSEPLTLTLDQILMDLKGFGVEDTELPVEFVASGKKISLRLSNVPTEDELETLLAVEEFKGHAWIARVKAETLSRSISWLNGIDLRQNSDAYVVDPTNGQEAVIRVALRNLIMGWGQEIVNVLWKILMVHCQQIEDRLFESLPDSQVMTEVEKRLISQAMLEVQEAQREVYKEAIRDIVDPK